MAPDLPLLLAASLYLISQLMSAKRSHVWQESAFFVPGCHLALGSFVDNLLATGADTLGNLAQPSDKGPTPLHWAASHGHVEIARMLMQGDAAWAALTQQQEDGRIPLHLAAVHGYPEVARVLIEGRPSQIRAPMVVGMRDDSKRTALYSACSIGGGNAGPSNTAAVAEVLLEYGPEFIDAGDGTGTCPLHLAARQGDVALVQVLLKHSPELDAIDDAGRTALTCATIEGHLEATRVLLEAGASPSIVDASGSDARSWAHVLEHDQILALFD